MHRCSCSSCKCSMQNNNSNNNLISANSGLNMSKSVFPENPMLAQSYVPIQYIDETFTPDCGLKNGTIFPELVNNYYPGQSIMDIDYIKMVSSREIGAEV